MDLSLKGAKEKVAGAPMKSIEMWARKVDRESFKVLQAVTKLRKTVALLDASRLNARHFSSVSGQIDSLVLLLEGREGDWNMLQNEADAQMGLIPKEERYEWVTNVTKISVLATDALDDARVAGPG